MSATPLMGVEEAAMVLGFASKYPVYGLVKRGELRAHKIGGRLKISQDAIDELLANTEVARQPAAAPARPAVPATSGSSTRRPGREQAASAPWESRRARRAAG